MKLKICGVQPGDDLSFTASNEVTHVGFIQVEASRRYVRPEDVAEMSRAVHPNCRKVGVYVNTPTDAIIKTASMAKLDIIQLHGSETIEDCKTLRQAGFEVWKAMSVKPEQGAIEDAVSQILAFAAVVDAVLLDSTPPKGTHTSVTGGHGAAFDWSQLARLNETLNPQSGSHQRVPVWIAGGIRPENVSDLLQHFIPYGLDVSSGVEVNQRKSVTRIEAMRKAVSRHANSTTS